MGKLFGTDGIRGKSGRWPLVPEFFFELGKALGKVINDGELVTHVVVGRDTRQSGQMLASAFITGLLSNGIYVIDLGVIPTPGVSWLVQKLGMKAGAVISASHNPVEQNGIKFFDSSGRKMSSILEDEIEALVSSTSTRENIVKKRNQHEGKLINGDSFKELYIKGLLLEHETVDFESLKIIVDCSNGATSFIAPETLTLTGAKIIPINSTPTGLNINVESGSEWARRQPQEYGNIIRKNDADFAVAFDGDGDRVVFVDKNGCLVDGDHILGLLAQSFSQEKKLLACSLVTTSMRNSGLVQFLEERGIQTFETPVGDKYVVEKLQDLMDQDQRHSFFGLGGEQSGHIVILDDDHPTGDGIRTCLYVIKEFLKSSLESFSLIQEYISKTPQIIGSANVGYDTRLSDEDLQELYDTVRRENPGITRLNLRYSGTEPKFRIMIEGTTNITIQELGVIAKNVCMHIQQVSNSPGQHIDLLNCTSGGVISV